MTFPGRLARDTRRRAVFIWAGVRVLLFLGTAVAASSVPDLRVAERMAPAASPLLGLVALLWVIGITGMLVLLDVRVVRETLLFANLGLSRVHLLRLALPPVIVLESLMQLAFVALRQL